MSPSARKVWIEMRNRVDTPSATKCHLPRGRCGLKFGTSRIGVYAIQSPSARKVWIEILATFAIDTP